VKAVPLKARSELGYVVPPTSQTTGHIVLFWVTLVHVLCNLSPFPVLAFMPALIFDEIERSHQQLTPKKRFGEILSKWWAGI